MVLCLAVTQTQEHTPEITANLQMDESGAVEALLGAVKERSWGLAALVNTNIMQSWKYFFFTEHLQLRYLTDMRLPKEQSDVRQSVTAQLHTVLMTETSF